MNPKKLYYVLLICFTLGIIGIFATVFLANGYLQKSSNKLVAAKVEAKTLEEQERIYTQAKKDIAKYDELGKSVAKVLPKDKDQARAVLELYKIGDEVGIAITGITFPTSTLGSKAKATTPATPGAAATTATTSQAVPVAGITGVEAINVDLEFSPKNGSVITYSQMLNFLDKIQKNRRYVQITKVSATPTGQSGGIKLNLSLRIFVKP